MSKVTREKQIARTHSWWCTQAGTVVAGQDNAREWGDSGYTLGWGKRRVREGEEASPGTRIEDSWAHTMGWLTVGVGAERGKGE